MSRIQINDLNSSNFGFLSELTDEEMSGINGVAWATLGKIAFGWLLGKL